MNFHGGYWGMKKCILLLIVFSLVLVGCGASTELKEENESLSNQVESLTAEKESISANLESVSDDYDRVNQELTSINESIETAEKETEVQSGDVTVTVLDKSSKEGRYGTYYCTLVFQVTNNTDKDIQGVEGTLSVMDLFGKTILKAGCDFTGQTISAKQSITVDDLSFEVNEFIDENVEFYTTEFKDLKFEYEVSKIVFTDGTMKQ